MRSPPEEESRLFHELLSSQEPQRLPRLAEELHMRYYRLIYYFLRLFSIPDDQQHDLFNQIFLKIMRGLAKLRHCDNIKSWVVTIAKNEIFSFIHRREREVRFYCVADDTTAPAAGGGDKRSALFTPEQHLFDKQLCAAFQESVSGLGEEIKKPFLLRYREFLKWKEIASMLDINIDTVRKRAERARQQVLGSMRRTLGPCRRP